MRGKKHILISVLLCFVLLFVLFVSIICWFVSFCFVLFASCLVRVVLVVDRVACCLFCVVRLVLFVVAGADITILTNAIEFVHHNRPVMIVVTI